MVDDAKTSDASQNRINKTDRRLVVLIAATISILAARLVASFFPDQRLWGLNHAAYIEGLWILYPAMILIAAFIYYKRDIIENTLPDDSRPAGIWGRAFIFPAFILTLVPVFGFYLLSVKAYFLGDGYSLIASMAQPEIAFKTRSYGEMLLHHLYMVIFYEANDYYAFLSYRHLSGLAGIIFLVTILYYGRKITNSAFEYCSFIALSLTMAATILFYGYIENYSLLTAGLVLFFFSAVNAIKNKKRSVVPIAAYLASVFMHSMALVYLPACIIYIINVVRRDKKPHFFEIHPGLFAMILLGVTAVVYVVIRSSSPSFWQQALLSPMGDRFTIDGYTLLSGSHIVDYINLLIFLIPVLLIAGGLYLIQKCRPSESGNRITVSPERLFLFTGTIMGLAAAFLLEPKLGMARDWDVMSVYLIGAGFTGIYIWIAYCGKIRYYRTATALLLMVQLSIFIPWVALNNSTSALYDYSISMMELDPKHGRATFFRMIAYNRGNNRPVEAARLNLYCQDNFPEMWLNKEAMDRMTTGNFDEAEDLLSQALEHNPAFFSIHLNKALCHLYRNNIDSVFEYLQFADALNPYNTFIHSFFGLAYYQSGNPDKAGRSWLTGLEFDARNPLPYLYLGYKNLKNGEYDSAVYYIRQYPGVVDIYPVYFQLGTDHLMRDDSLTVFDSLYDRFLSQADSASAEKTSEVISDLRIHHRAGQ